MRLGICKIIFYSVKIYMCYREIFKDIIFVDMQYLLFLSPAAYQAGLKADVGVHTVRPGLKVF